MKITLFKKKNSLKKKDFSFHPNFYWRIILLGAAAIILLSFIFSYQLFTRINQEPILPSVNEKEAAGAISLDRILKALNYFSEREKKSNKILNSSSSVVDPSL